MDSSQAKEKNSADLFASDIFAAPRVEEIAESELTAAAVESEKPCIWRLPKTARPAVDWNALRRNLPADFYADLPRSLAESLAKQLDSVESNRIEFLFLVEREISEFAEISDDSWWLNIGGETGAAEFAVEISDVFAVWLVDAMLGEKQVDALQIRELTPTEIAVLEFLAVNLTHEANRIINAPLFKFRGLSRKIPASLNKIPASENHLLVTNWQTVHGFLNSIVKLYVTPESLKALNADENELLTAAPRRRRMWNALQNRVADVRTRLFLGEVTLTVAEIAGLETGDVLLPENYDFSIAGAELSGGAEIFLGDDEQTRIGGAFASFEEESSAEFEETDGGGDNEILVRRVKSNKILQIAVERFDESDNLQTLEKSMSNEQTEFMKPTAEFGEGGEGIALENLAVTLRVELEARRLTLAEVGNLRINQIIELGVSAADPVNLLIDNKTIARGELVEVEDRLGVRIIQILR